MGYSPEQSQLFLLVGWCLLEGIHGGGQSCSCSIVISLEVGKKLEGVAKPRSCHKRFKPEGLLLQC